MLSPEDLKRLLPRYRSHKIVQAAKILGFWRLPLRLRLDVDVRPGTADGDVNVLGPFGDAVFQPKAGTLPYEDRLEAGWWLIIYEDGHMSLSPAKAFEEGYALADPPERAADTSFRGITQCAHPVGAFACKRFLGHDGPHETWGNKPAAPDDGPAGGVSLTTASHPVGPPAPPEPTRCSARHKITEDFFLHCDLIKGHPGAHRDRTEHGWGYTETNRGSKPGPAAGASDGPAAAAPRVPRNCGVEFEAIPGHEISRMPCTYPAGHDGPHGRAFPHT